MRAGISCIVGLSAAFCLSVLPCFGQTQQYSVVDGSGNVASNGSYLSISAVGQPGGYSYGVNGVVQHYGGFLGIVPCCPALDTDSDGLVNELDSDNDADGLPDWSEVNGLTWAPAAAVTDPNVADTDGDTMTDWEEAIAGTNPTNSNRRLEIISAESETASNGVAITWFARHGRIYSIWRTDDLVSPSELSVIGVVAADDPSAVPPWYLTAAEYHDAGVMSSNSATYFYFVEVEP